MITVLLALVLSVAILAIVAPGLRRITEGGHAPRLSALAWLMVSMTLLVSWALAGIGALWAPHHGPMWTMFRAGAVNVTGSSWPVDVIRVVVGVALILPLARFLYSLNRVLGEARRGRGRKRTALRLLGRADTTHHGVVEIVAGVPMVYCIPGKPDVIVVTTGAKESLCADQFAAVLAHERAHLAEWHHLLVAVAHAVGLVSRRVWLFRHTARFVRVLVEMRADDVAVRRFGSDILTAAMRKLSATAPPEPALGASGVSVVARIMRMTYPPTRAQRVLAAVGVWSFAGLSCLVLVLAILVPVIAMTVGDTCLYMASSIFSDFSSGADAHKMGAIAG